MTAVTFIQTTLRYISILLLIFLIGCSSGGGSSTDSPAESRTDGSQKLHPQEKFNVPVFVYHRFADPRYPVTNIDTAIFRRHLQLLKKEGWKAVSVGEFLSLKALGQSLDKICLITIDDGYRSVKNGIRILAEFGFSATVFVNTSTVGAGDYMDWDDLKGMLEQGFDIGNHTHSHPFILNTEPELRSELLREELTTSQELFKQHLDFEPAVFAYPYGEYDPLLFAVLDQFGFQLSFAQNSGVFNDQSDTHAIPRFPVNEQYGSLERFTERMRMSALEVRYSSSNEHEVPLNSKPDLQLVIDVTDLQIEQLQFFAGGVKQKHLLQDSLLTLRSTAGLKSRRTLYTVTCPDKNGNWYWFSHLWVIPELSDQ